MKYLLIIEHGENNLSAYFPDLPGCAVTGSTLEDVRQSAKEVLEMHLEDEDAPPTPSRLADLTAELDGSETTTWIEYEHGHALA
jgi:predicted RNase H-like HicB family nuclease